MAADSDLTARTLADAALSGSEPAVEGMSPDAAVFLGRELIRPFIRRQAETIGALIANLPWRFPVCPVCGGHPGFSKFQKVKDDAAYITGHGGPRFLRCGVCATWWRHKRVSCPGCGNEEPSRLSFLRSPERPYERVDVCEDCMRYLPCLDTTEMIRVLHPDVAALAMLPLEIMVRDRGYHPLAGHPWNAVPAGPGVP
jgi:FdhE protein